MAEISTCDGSKSSGIYLGYISDCLWRQQELFSVDRGDGAECDADDWGHEDLRRDK